MTPVPPDKLIRGLFESSPLAQFAASLPDGRIVAHNGRFLAFLGYAEAEFGRREISLDDVVDADSQPLFYDSGEPCGPDAAPRVVNFIRGGGETIEGEVTISKVEIDGGELLLCHVRDLSGENVRGRKRQEDAAASRRRNIEVARANVRLYELTERVSTTYDLTASLLDSKNIDDLMQKASAILTDRAGLNAREVAFVIRDGDRFKVKVSGGGRIKRVDREECERALTAMEPDEVTADPARGVLILPLVSRDEVHGVLRVAVDSAASPVFAAPDEVIRAGALDIFKTLANMISIMIDNLRLYHDLERQSVIDPLTGAYNRRYFDRKSRVEVKRAGRYGEELSFVLVDIDNLKEVNDRWGHLAGDRVLKDITDLLKGHCREEDAVCRYGGDEFLIILVETGLDGAMQKAQNLRRLVEDTAFEIPGRPQEAIRITISCGVAGLSGEAGDEEKLFHAVDQALYRAKQTKNTVSK